MIIEAKINGTLVIFAGDNIALTIIEDKDPNFVLPPLTKGRGLEVLREWIAQSRGRQGALAKQLGISTQAISGWTEVPADKVPMVSRVTGIPTNVLRADLYGEST